MVDPIKIDYTLIRCSRQKINDSLVKKALKETNIDLLEILTNKKEIDRLLHEVNLTYEELLVRCKNDDVLNTVVAGRISKNSSRQCSRDETSQLHICNLVTSRYGIYIKKLNTKAFRPTKKGTIVSKKQMYKKKICKEDCLKSFDAKMSGKMRGWVFAKVVIGIGGHQDNVFEEIESLCRWITTHKNNTKETFLFLIDTDQDKKVNCIKRKYRELKNLLIMNHYEFQDHVIKNFEIISEI